MNELKHILELNFYCYTCLSSNDMVDNREMVIEQELERISIELGIQFILSVFSQITLFDSISFWPEDTLIGKGFKHLPV